MADLKTRLHMKSRAGPQSDSRDGDDAAGGDNQSHTAGLLRTIETQVIPRLVLARTPRTVHATEGAAVQIQQQDVTALAERCMEEDGEATRRLIDDLLQRGCTVETLFRDLLAPAARLLGNWWEDDRADFVAVTIGLCRLQQVLHWLSTSFENQGGGRQTRFGALLAAFPGNQHTFGVSLLSEFFRRAGWNVQCSVGTSRGALLREVREEWFDVAGISIGCAAELTALPVLVAELRKASRNPHLVVMAGGPACLGMQDGEKITGADVIAEDAQVAVTLAEQRVEALAKGNGRSARAGG